MKYNYFSVSNYVLLVMPLLRGWEERKQGKWTSDSQAFVPYITLIFLLGGFLDFKAC